MRETRPSGPWVRNLPSTVVAISPSFGGTHLSGPIEPGAGGLAHLGAALRQRLEIAAPTE
jgi:hypothetical protein